MRTTPRLYLGTMTFSWSQTSSRVDESVATKMLESFVAHNNNNEQEDASQTKYYIDTARIYAGGKTEKSLGMILGNVFDADASSSTMKVGTKAHPSQPNGLSPQGIQDQLTASLGAMKLTNVDEYYLHQPDPDHSLLDSLTFLDSLVADGTIAAIGMSNYHVDEMERAFELCREHNLTPPTVYQGLYNPLNRLVEDDLLPLLQKNECSFVAYNPLAAGLLSGKHVAAPSDDDDETTKVLKGRFRNNPNYLPRFYTPANFKAVDLIRKACQDQDNLSMVEATYRWLLHHSALGPKDGILLGASSMSQLDENLAACRGAPLSPTVQQAFDAAWEITRAQSPFPYWRSYSLDMPDRESRDPGASYSATKK